MEKTVFISMPLQELQSIIIDCVTACLKHNTPQPTIQATEKPLSVNEAAAFLNLEPATIYGLVHKREIPYSKPTGSKRLYFSKQELTDWLKGGRKKTAAEMATDAGNYLRKGPKAKGAK